WLYSRRPSPSCSSIKKRRSIEQNGLGDDLARQDRLRRRPVEALGAGALAEILDGDGVELRHHLLTQLLPGWPDDLVGERRADRQVVGLGLGLEVAHHPHHLAQG